jgi:hypothetical protein
MITPLKGKSLKAETEGHKLLGGDTFVCLLKTTTNIPLKNSVASQKQHTLQKKAGHNDVEYCVLTEKIFRL